MNEDLERNIREGFSPRKTNRNHRRRPEPGTEEASFLRLPKALLTLGKYCGWLIAGVVFLFKSYFSVLRLAGEFYDQKAKVSDERITTQGRTLEDHESRLRKLERKHDD